MEPAKLHVHSFFKRDNGIIGDINIYVTFTLYGLFGLCLDHFHEILAEGYHFFGSYEEACKL